MLLTPKIDNYFKILTDEEVKDFVVIKVSKVVELLYIFLTTPGVVEKNV